MTDEQSRLVCRKIDRVILPVLAWVYFLQILDKSVLVSARSLQPSRSPDGPGDAPNARYFLPRLRFASSGPC